MKVVFVSNYLNHHQIPFCLAMQSLTDNNFFFLAMEAMTEDRKNMGWGLEKEYPFMIEVKKNREYALELVNKADVVICGGSAYMNFIRERVENDKLTFWYSERIYKRGVWRAISPRGFYYMTRDHGRYRNKNLYLLCASAYAPFDFSLTGSYIGKAYKWGYFPEFREYDVDELFCHKKNNEINILWVARFVGLKHPEYPVMLAERLKKEGCAFKLNMIGNGELLPEISNMVTEKGLNDNVNLLGNMKPAQVREYMEKANIFLFTSDFNEGWGAVLNESMNSGCAVVASHAIGATPFLVEHEKNGLIYQNGDFEDFYNKVKVLIDNDEFREKIGKEAYLVIKNQWNAENAAKRLYDLFEAKLNYTECKFESGPCSKAKIITNRWFKK